MKTKRMEYKGEGIELRYSEDAGEPAVVVMRKGSSMVVVVTAELRLLPSDDVRRELADIASAVGHMAETYRGAEEVTH